MEYSTIHTSTLYTLLHLQYVSVEPMYIFNDIQYILFLYTPAFIVTFKGTGKVSFIYIEVYNGSIFYSDKSGFLVKNVAQTIKLY